MADDRIQPAGSAGPHPEAAYARSPAGPELNLQKPDSTLSTLIPYNNPNALIAYYCGVFALIPVLGLLLGPAALVLGILGIQYVKAHPTAKGTGHAIAGIVLGSITTLFNLALLVGIVVFMLKLNAVR